MRTGGQDKGNIATAISAIRSFFFIPDVPKILFFINLYHMFRNQRDKFIIPHNILVDNKNGFLKYNYGERYYGRQHYCGEEVMVSIQGMKDPVILFMLPQELDGVAKIEGAKSFEEKTSAYYPP